MLHTLGREAQTLLPRPVPPGAPVMLRWFTRPPAKINVNRPGGWKFRGLCSKLPLELSDPLFFGTEENVPPEGLIVAVNAARRVCAACPVARTCLTDALLTDQRYGVRAGTSGRERGKLRLRLAAGATIADLVDECLTP